MRNVLLALVMLMASASAYAEGRCPPGQYPIGGQGAGGCAPIPSGGSGGPALSIPTGKWETRWGAIASGMSQGPNPTMATGVSVSQTSKKLAQQIAVQECKKLGGVDCEVQIAYHNQCVAIADPLAEERSKGRLTSSFMGAKTESEASRLALERCAGHGARCEIVYSACSMSEFRRF